MLRRLAPPARWRVAIVGIFDSQRMQSTPRPDARLMRTVDRAGFQTTLAIQQPEERITTKALDVAEARLQAGQNVLLVGPLGTGKRTFLARVPELLPDRRVAMVSTRGLSATKLNAIPFAPFLGLKPNTEVLSVETAAASMARHVRAMNGSFDHCFPCITTCDALVLHGLELVPPMALRALDMVAREERGRDAPFGGLQIIASADFWRQPVSPSSPLVGNLYQMDEWPTYFPPEGQLPLTRFFRQDTEADPKTWERTLRALAGNLTDEDVGGLTRARDTSASENTISLLDNRRGRAMWAPRFCKQPAQAKDGASDGHRKVMRATTFGQYLLQTLVHSARVDTAGMTKSLHLDPGNSIAFSWPMQDKAGNVTVEAGTCGTVTSLSDHFITVRVANSRSTINVPRLRVHTAHTRMPALPYTVTQFPLYPTDRLYPAALTEEMVPVPRGRELQIDARLLTSVGDLGNLMALLPTTAGTFLRLEEYLARDGFVYEPLRAYFERLLAAQDPDAARAAGFALSDLEERWCRNCKVHVPGASYHAHWDACVRDVRWCADCSTTIPAAKWEAHCEKHTIVMCLDCGMSLEWRFWEQHRKLCGAMLRELSPDNEHLPATTKVTTLEAHVDRTDLHTVKAIRRDMLPRRHTDVEAGPRVRALPR